MQSRVQSMHYTTLSLAYGRHSSILRKGTKRQIEATAAQLIISDGLKEKYENHKGNKIIPFKDTNGI